jgi:regulator of nucleoside diphosphate kinase
MNRGQPIEHRRRIPITTDDLRELRLMVNSARKHLRGLRYLDSLAEDLAEAEVVEPNALPADVVAMGSTVRLRELPPQEERVYVLVFPRQASYEGYRVSALSPIGAALLGARTGEVVCVDEARGKRRFRIEGVTHKADSAA